MNRIYKKVPIKKVAEELKISISTVSRALSDHPRISKDTKEKVLAVAQRLEMFQVPPLQARIGTQSGHIAIVIPKAATWYYKTFLDGIRSVTDKFDYHIVVVEYDRHGKDFIEQVQYAYSLPVCGLIIHIPDIEEVDLLKLNKNNLPTVLHGTSSSKYPYPKLISDYFMETYAAVSHLYNTGCRKVAYLPKETQSYVGKTRMTGFQRSIEYYKISDESQIVLNGLVHSTYEEKLRQIMNYGIEVEAFIVDEGRLIPYLLRLLDSHSFNVPSQIKIVSLDEDDLMQILTPSITTVLTPIAEIGRLAVRVIHKQLTGEKITKDSLLIIKPKLIIRNSSIQ